MRKIIIEVPDDCRGCNQYFLKKHCSRYESSIINHQPCQACRNAEVSLSKFKEALIACNIIDREAIEDYENYDEGMIKERVEEAFNQFNTRE